MNYHVQEIDGVRTSNGIQYRLQLLYSNGEFMLRITRESETQKGCDVCAANGMQLFGLVMGNEYASN